ncbi:protein S100-A13 isoform X1 [Papio anubis]|uniref:protein S100-A13 isoform X1 n=1 Tax=Papio anubis TaxID=9555 RepID=UPI000B7B8CEC|nr:protein S100-A13 isoform X1 [Papio anubis]
MRAQFVVAGWLSSRPIRLLTRPALSCLSSAAAASSGSVSKTKWPPHAVLVGPAKMASTPLRQASDPLTTRGRERFELRLRRDQRRSLKNPPLKFDTSGLVSSSLLLPCCL